MGSPLSASMTDGHYDMAHEDENPDLAELSQELEEVEWLGLSEPGAYLGSGHAADHWTFEIALVIVGALLGVALYFWMT